MSVKTAHVINPSAEEATSLPAWSMVFPARRNVVSPRFAGGALGACPVLVSAKRG
ncbi:hypothetical protein [Streptomyces sp. NPDC005538]|uniref:hypothetical protein n=1 Tax=Streptomyces sp. NPDC005538 TaxID=3157043 RepID=UPI0033BD0066